MSGYEIIREGIRELDGGTFQTLAQKYAMKKFNLLAPSFLGTDAGTMKPAKGNPDAFYKDSDGNYVFVAAGSVENHLNAKSKMKDDVYKCLSDERGLKGCRLSRIICCYTCGRLTPSDISEIEDIDSRVRLIGPDEMAIDIYEQFFSLAQEYFGYSKTGQIMDEEQFLKLNDSDMLAATLSNEIRFRDKELKRVADLLEENRVIAISGRSGCGKTRFAIEIARSYGQKHDIPYYFIKSRDVLIVPDLEMFFSDGSDKLFVVDDVNCLIDLKGFMQFVLLNDNLHIILTVRDYAVSVLNNSLKSIKNSCIYPINSLRDDDIEFILKNDFEINNPIYLERIITVAHGNLRIAILAAIKAKNGLITIMNCKDILNICYEDAIQSLSDTEVAAGEIASILDRHVTSNNRALNMLETICQKDHRSYIAACVELHQKPRPAGLHAWNRRIGAMSIYPMSMPKAARPCPLIVR